MLIVALVMLPFALMKLGCGCPYHTAVGAACARSRSDLPEAIPKVYRRAANQFLRCFCLVYFLQESLVSAVISVCESVS